MPPESMRDLLTKHSIMGRLNAFGKVAVTANVAFAAAALSTLIFSSSPSLSLLRIEPSRTLVWSLMVLTALSCLSALVAWRRTQVLPLGLRVNCRVLVIIMLVISIFKSVEGWRWMQGYHEWRPELMIAIVACGITVTYGFGIRANGGVPGNDSALNRVG
jgi:hypothetical protein